MSEKTNRRKFLTSVGAIGAASALLGKAMLAQKNPGAQPVLTSRTHSIRFSDREIEVPDDGWHLWLDRSAPWKDDRIFLPEETRLDRLPVNASTGGWPGLVNGQSLEVTLLEPSYLSGRTTDMTMHVFESLLLLIYFDAPPQLRSRLLCCARATPCISPQPGDRKDGSVCRAVDVACVFYFRQVHCLQKSAATVILLRRHGFDARMVIGAQILPFKAHAWVEVDGTVVNDKPYVSDIYSVLERC